MKTFFIIVAVLVVTAAAVPVIPVPEANVGTVQVTPKRPTNEEELNLEYGIVKDMFEGDIKLTPKQKELMSESKHQIHERAVVRDRDERWPGAVIPYVMDSSLGSAQINGINRAIQEYHAKTCIRFKRRERERDYVRFVRRNGCYSYIGRVGDSQEVSIGRGCESLGIVLHEMFHVLGRWHEQSRPDRDQYIRINFNNIRNGLADQFERVSTRLATTNGVGYDYFTLMHYDAYAFSRNRQPTIVPLNSGVNLNDLGQRNTFSPKDFQHINALYSCGAGGPETVTLAPSSQWSSWSQWSSCSAACGRGTRQRTRTCTRGGNCVGSSRETARCFVRSCSSQWGSWGSWSSCSPSCGNNRVRSRSRNCQGFRCEGPSREVQRCQNIDCGSTNNNWSEWSRCSRQCNGYRWRRRRSPPFFEFEICNTNCSPRQRVNREVESEPREARSQLKVIIERETGSEPKADKEIKPQPRFNRNAVPRGIKEEEEEE